MWRWQEYQQKVFVEQEYQSKVYVKYVAGAGIPADGMWAKSEQKYQQKVFIKYLFSKNTRLKYM